MDLISCTMHDHFIGVLGQEASCSCSALSLHTCSQVQQPSRRKPKPFAAQSMYAKRAYVRRLMTVHGPTRSAGHGHRCGKDTHALTSLR